MDFRLYVFCWIKRINQIFGPYLKQNLPDNILVQCQFSWKDLIRLNWSAKIFLLSIIWAAFKIILFFMASNYNHNATKEIFGDLVQPWRLIYWTTLLLSFLIKTTLSRIYMSLFLVRLSSKPLFEASAETVTFVLCNIKDWPFSVLAMFVHYKRISDVV